MHFPEILDVAQALASLNRKLISKEHSSVWFIRELKIVPLQCAEWCQRLLKVVLHLTKQYNIVHCDDCEPINQTICAMLRLHPELLEPQCEIAMQCDLQSNSYFNTKGVSHKDSCSWKQTREKTHQLESGYHVLEQIQMIAQRFAVCEYQDSARIVGKDYAAWTKLPVVGKLPVPKNNV